MTAVERVLSALRDQGKTVQERGGAYDAQCPVHDDDRPSLGVRSVAGKALLCCRVGCATADVAAALGLTMADLFDEQTHKGKPVVVAEYPYTDAAGKVLFVKERKAPKTFIVKRPDGRGGWIYRDVFKGTGAPERVLYRLPEVRAAARDGRTVYVVEGEKDADRLAALGHVATCNFDGAAKDGQRPKWRSEYGDALVDADVVVIADRDEAGMAHARAILDDLQGKAKSVVLVQAKVETEHADVSDHLAAGYGLDELVPVDSTRALARAALLAAAREVDEGKDVARVLARLEDRLNIPDRIDTSTPHLPGLPSYPRGDLIGPLADLVATGIVTGLPAPYLGGAGLATLATVAGSARLRISDTWMVRPVLWVPLIGPAGSAKTPTLDVVRGKLRELDSITAGAYINAWKDWQALPASERDDPPQDNRRLIDDATLEALALRLDSGDAVLGVDSDELSEWLGGLSRYRSGGASDRTRWLSLWSSSPWTVDRAGGRKLHIPCPVVTVCGGLQPHLAHLLGPDGDGMRPRWLPHPSPDLDLTWRPGSIADTWADTIEALYNDRDEREWSLSDAAMSAWTSARAQWKAQTRGVETPSTIAALAKADTQAARIALVLAESQDPARREGVVDEDTMGAAIGIVRYVLDVWRALPEHGALALSRRDEVLDAGVDELAVWLDRHGGTATRREIQRARVCGVRTADALDALLQRYEAVYPGSVRSERTGERGPKGIVVYAPRRGNAQSSGTVTSTSPQSVTGDTFGSLRVDVGARETAGRSASDSARTNVTTGDTLSGDTSLVPVSGTERNWRPDLTLVDSDDDTGEWTA